MDSPDTTSPDPTGPDMITVATGPVALGARSWPGGVRRPVLLVHGLSSNARLWDGVATHLSAAGHPVVAVDLRGHGSSATVPDTASDTASDATHAAARDLAAVCARLGWVGSGDFGADGGGSGGAGSGWAPVVAGQSWGGNVVLQLAADRPDLVHALALIDGGWLHLGDRWPTLDAAWEVLAPPRFTGLTAAALRSRLRTGHPGWADTAIEATLGNLREHPDGTVTPWLHRDRHRAIVASLLAHRPRELYPLVRCPVLLLAATIDDGPDKQVVEAVTALAHAELVEFPGGDHDLQAQYPARVATLIGGLA